MWPVPPGVLERMPASLSVVVATYDRYEVLHRALESLAAQQGTRDFCEVIVVDNSPDQAAAARWARKHSGLVARYELCSTPGLSNARNVGLALATAPVVAFMDDD